MFPIHNTLFSTLSQFRSVRFLHLQQIEFGSIDILRRIVGALPSVETAVLRSISWKTSVEGGQILFKPLHNATSWRLSQVSLRHCSSDFVAPLFWASPHLLKKASVEFHCVASDHSPKNNGVFPRSASVSTLLRSSNNDHAQISSWGCKI